MRKPHPSYELFAKEQKPKYGNTFMEWYSENSKIGDSDILSELSKKNIKYRLGEFNGHVYSEKEYIGVFKDFFTKKLQLCNTLISYMANKPWQYDFDIVADVMDVYEDVIQDVCTKDNIYVCGHPNVEYNKSLCQTTVFKYRNFEELKTEMSTGLIIFYYFEVLDDFSIEARLFKWEPLTRTVLFEGNN
jgi:hypothetical protein